MRTLRQLLATGLIGFCTFASDAALTQARLVLSAETAKPGDTVMAGVVLQMPEPWHTYWRNPGEFGIPTTIKWALPPGINAGEIQWPVPEKATVADATTYQYEREVVLLVPLKLPADLKTGEVKLAAKVEWLECDTGGKCVKGNQDVSVKLNIGSETKPSDDPGQFINWQLKLPKTAVHSLPSAQWEKGSGDSRSLIIEWNVKEAGAADFFPYENTNYDVAPLTKTLPAKGGKVRLKKTVTKAGDAWPTTIRGLLVQKHEKGETAFEVALKISTDASSEILSSAPQSFLQMLLFAFIGGLILNIMPCVFPVIALKIFGFVQQSHDDPRQVFRLGLIYGLGVLVSFLVLATLVIVVKEAGGAASWGMQLQSPQFSVALLLLVALVAMNLFGVFEVNLGGGAMSVASQLASKHGAPGAFFNGVLATMLATPCTAPFLAPALGFAFLQPPPVILLFFITIGTGLASPYILLSAKPGWLKFLPRPGAWMEKFKVAMGFPMLATAVWIFWFTAPRFGDSGALWLGLFLVVVAFAVWVWGQFVQRGGGRRGVAVIICLAMLAGIYCFALEHKLHWRSPSRNVEAFWQPWSPEAVEKARAEGRPVLVDFTANWCLTCNIYVKPALDDAKVRAKIKELNAAALLADNTDFPPAIATELKKFGSAGVPMVLVYPRDASQPPIVLQEFPTIGAARRRILDALTKAAP